jgi:hypothetical protein
LDHPAAAPAQGIPEALKLSKKLSETKSRSASSSGGCRTIRRRRRERYDPHIPDSGNGGVMGIIVALFQLWLGMAAIMLVLVLPAVMLGAFASGVGEAVSEVLPHRYLPDNDRAAALAAVKPQRIVFWWLPHDQGP